MQAVILCGGSGTRLKPLTNFYNKALVPINDKFILEFPIQTLKSLGVTDLVVVLGDTHFSQIVSFLKDGSDFGINISYVYQQCADGIAHAINLTKNLIRDDFFCILGDNIFSGDISYKPTNKSCHIFLKETPELYRFGVASVDLGSIIKIEEKPKIIDTKYNNFAISGLYKFDKTFFEKFKYIKKSARGEFEITEIINSYLKEDNLSYTIYKGFWQDCGTHEAIKIVRNHLENGIT